MGVKVAPLTLEFVRERVEKILEMDRHNHDPKVAHDFQDHLYEAVLRLVVADHPDAKAMAAECLKVAESDGVRWYA